MKYFLIAGEASGDLHASNLMKGLLAEDPKAEFRYWGGEKMQAVAGTLLHHYKEGAVMGVSDVLSKGFKLLNNLKQCKRDILDYAPDAVILVDYPGFNLKIAKFAHSKGFKVFYYIAPKTWASREGRNRKLRKWVDMMYIVFPFEIEYFTRKGVPFVYKGNPLVEAIEQTPVEKLTDEAYIAMLPGSRKGEISRTMPICMKEADRLHSDPKYAGMKFIVAGAPSRDESDYASYLQGREDYVSLVFGKTYSIISGAQAAIVNSGTASLETALFGVPQMVCWSSTPVTIFLAKHVLKVQNHIKYISLGNLIVDRLVFKEFIQTDFSIDNVDAELRRLLEDEDYRNTMLQGYAEIKKALGQGAASKAFAKDIISRI